MLKGEQIAEANLTDWRKLAQGLHARYLVDDFTAGARFVAAAGEAGDGIGHHPRVSMGNGYVDLKLVTDDESETSSFTTQSSRKVPSRTKPSFSRTRADASLRVSVSDWTRFRSSVSKAHSSKARAASVA